MPRIPWSKPRHTGHFQSKQAKGEFIFNPNSFSIARNSPRIQRRKQSWMSTIKGGIRRGCLVSRIIKYLVKEADR